MTNLLSDGLAVIPPTLEDDIALVIHIVARRDDTVDLKWQLQTRCCVSLSDGDPDREDLQSARGADGAFGGHLTVRETHAGDSRCMHASINQSCEISDVSTNYLIYNCTY